VEPRNSPGRRRRRSSLVVFGSTDVVAFDAPVNSRGLVLSRTAISNRVLEIAVLVANSRVESRVSLASAQQSHIPPIRSAHAIPMVWPRWLIGWDGLNGPCRLHVIFMPCGDLVLLGPWVAQRMGPAWFFQVLRAWVRVKYPLGQSGPRLGRHRQIRDVLVGKSLRGTI
jgi:hypothetical protein